MCLLFAGSGGGRAVAVVELKGAIAIAVVEYSAPSVFCVPEMSDSDHDAPACGTMAVPKPTSKSSVPPKPSGSLTLASPNERPAQRMSFQIEYSHRTQMVGPAFAMATPKAAAVATRQAAELSAQAATALAQDGDCVSGSG